MTNNQLTKYVLYLGLNDKDTKTQYFSKVEAVKILFKLFEAATITEATGFYKHNDGEVVIEETLKIELMFVDDKFVHNACKELKRLFNQESVAVEKIISESRLA